MLKIDDLENFCKAFQQENSEIKDVLLLADDDDYSVFVKGIRHNKKQVVLIAIIPSVNVAFKSKDNLKYKNFLNFMIMQKGDEKRGYEALMDKMKFTQPLIKKLYDFMLEKYGSIDDCMFKDFDLSQAIFDPITNYQRTDGYSLSIPLNTKS